VCNRIVGLTASALRASCQRVAALPCAQAG
jgi:hypothetical protein